MKEFYYILAFNPGVIQLNKEGGMTAQESILRYLAKAGFELREKPDTFEMCAKLYENDPRTRTFIEECLEPMFGEKVILDKLGEMLDGVKVYKFTD